MRGPIVKWVRWVALATMALPFAPAHASGQPWIDRTTTGPSPREGAALAYDGGSAILFGGRVAAGLWSDETWSWNGEWRKLNPSVRPSARSRAAVTYDTARRVVVMYGGSNATPLSDTWEWNGTSWQQRFPTSGPGPVEGAMAYDPVAGLSILHTTTGSTWGWNGSTWTELWADTVTFPAREGFSMTYDATRARVVLHGGAAGCVDLAETWEWNGVTWAMSSPIGPSSYDGSLVYDPVWGRSVLVRGALAACGSERETTVWTWEGAWDRPPFSVWPPARSGHGATWDGQRRVMLIFGGDDGSLRNDTWELDLAPPIIGFVEEPPRYTSSSTARFTIGSSEEATFECSLDSGEPEPCDQTFTIGGLTEGPHALCAEGTDVAGNRSMPVCTQWDIDTTPPGLAVVRPAAGSTYIDDTEYPGAAGVTVVAGSTITVAVQALDHESPIRTVCFSLDLSDLGCLDSPDEDGTYRLAVPVPPATGPHTLRAVATNQAGGSASRSRDMVTVRAG